MSLSLRDVLRRLDAEQKDVALAEGTPESRPLWAFPSLAGTPQDHNNVGKAFRRVVKAAGLPRHFHIHCLRHTFASLLLQDGVSPAYVQEQLGHASIELTVGTYGRWLRKKAPGAVDGLDEDASAESGSKVVAGDLLPPVDTPQVVEGMVRPGRFERPTYRFVVCCSIQLS